LEDADRGGDARFGVGVGEASGDEACSGGGVTSAASGLVASGSVVETEYGADGAGEALSACLERSGARLNVGGGCATPEETAGAGGAGGGETCCLVSGGGAVAGGSRLNSGAGGADGALLASLVRSGGPLTTSRI
jgi:hypothetical protein